MKEIKITFNTLTPIWTGDAWGECNELKLTGIVGSLRWWFEALVRGMGYKACDSTSNNKCKVDIDIKNPKEILEINRNICPVCFLFGTTGWKSRISFEIEEDNLSKPYEGKITFKIDKKDRNHNSWHYEPGLMGNAILKVRMDEFNFGDGTKLTKIAPSVLKILLYLIQENGMFGAKASMGYGVVKFKVDGSNLSISKSDWNNFTIFLKFWDEKFKSEDRRLPNLKDMFFAKFSVDGSNNSIDNVINNMKSFMTAQSGIIEAVVDKWKDKNWVISSPIVRYCLRCIFRGNYSQKVCQLNRSCSRNYWWSYFGRNDGRNKSNSSYNSSLTIDNLSLSNCNETKSIRHFLMGSTDEKEFSSIQVSHVYSDNDSLEFRIWGWLPEIWPINGKVGDILELLTQIFKDIPWKERDKKETGGTIKIDCLKSSIKNNICWDGSSLKLINGSNSEELIRNIKSLFISQEV